MSDYMRMRRAGRRWFWAAVVLGGALIAEIWWGARRLNVWVVIATLALFLIATWREQRAKGWVAGYRAHEKEVNPL